MNVRGFNEGGGFAQEIHAKYDANVFYLLQVRALTLCTCVTVQRGCASQHTPPAAALVEGLSH